MECHYYPPQQPSPVLDYPYYEDEDVQSSTTQSPSTSSLHSFSSSFDNRSPPRSIPQQHFLPPTSSPTSSNPLNQHFGYSTQLAMSQPSQQQWSSNRRSTPISSFQLQGQLHSDDMAFNPTSSYVTTSENDMYSNSTIPRGWKNCNERILHSHNNNGLPSFAAIDYGDEDVNERNNQHTQLDSAMYQSLGNGRGYAPMSMASHHDCSSSPSHYPSLENLKFHSKTTTFSLADDGMSNAGTGTASREMTVEDEEGLGMDEPYAKLIHRALMSKPDHSMVLQDIYQWFRENTNKGSSDNKGWMNSIRHNLSMNAVCSIHSLSFLPGLLTYTLSRHSRKQNERQQGTRARNPLNGSLKILPSKRAYSPQRVTAKAQPTRNPFDQALLLPHASAQVRKEDSPLATLLVCVVESRATSIEDQG